MNWFDITAKYDELSRDLDDDLESLPEDWQRELAALNRLEMNVNNGAYLQFLTNCGRESYVYASRALHKIGARKMAEIIDRCQALVDEHFETETASREEIEALMPNEVIGLDGERLKEPRSILPDPVLDRIYELSDEFMDYPDDVERLGLKYYRSYLEREGVVSADDRLPPPRPVAARAGAMISPRPDLELRTERPATHVPGWQWLLQPLVRRFWRRRLQRRSERRCDELGDILGPASQCETREEFETLLGRPQYAMPGECFGMGPPDDGTWHHPDLVEVYAAGGCTIDVWFTNGGIERITGYPTPTSWDVIARDPESGCAE